MWMTVELQSERHSDRPNIRYFCGVFELRFVFMRIPFFLFSLHFAAATVIAVADSIFAFTAATTAVANAVLLSLLLPISFFVYAIFVLERLGWRHIDSIHLLLSSTASSIPYVYV